VIASDSFVWPMEGPKFFGYDSDHEVIYAKVVAATAVQPNPASAASLTQEDRDEAARVLARKVAKPPPGQDSDLSRLVLSGTPSAPPQPAPSPCASTPGQQPSVPPQPLPQPAAPPQPRPQLAAPPQPLPQSAAPSQPVQQLQQHQQQQPAPPPPPEPQRTWPAPQQREQQ